MLLRFAVLAAVLLALAAPGCVPPFTTTDADLARGSYTADPARAGTATESARRGSNAAGGESARRDSLVVASYNISFGDELDQAVRDLRSDPHLAGADILLLQEMDPEGCERIARALGMDFVYYPASIHPRHDRPFGNAVLVRGPIGTAGFVSLPRPPGLSGTPRIAVTAEIAVDGVPMAAASLHASTMILPLPERLKQVRAVLDRAGSWDGPAILGGDFNTSGVRDTLLVGRMMRKAGFRASHRNGEATIPLHWQARWSNCRILDHLYVRGLEVRRAGVVASARASDHFPIWAVYEWPPATVRLSPLDSVPGPLRSPRHSPTDPEEGQSRRSSRSNPR